MHIRILATAGAILAILGTGCGDSVRESDIAQSSSKVIYVNTSTQWIEACDSGRQIFHFPVSTGKASTPTDSGTHYIYEKREWDIYPTVKSSSDHYYSLYFNRGEAFHWAYWHNQFGRRAMSHGCVNMRQGDVSQLFRWAPIGTRVVVSSNPPSCSGGGGLGNGSLLPRTLPSWCAINVTAGQGRARIRTAANTDGQIVAELGREAKVRVEQKVVGQTISGSGDWYYVTFTLGGDKAGYIHSSLLDCTR